MWSIIRKYLPKSKIILSTWDGSNVNGLDYDIVIFNKDPGGSLCSANDDKILNNVNREIVSTLAGLKVCKTKYVFKIRSDLIIKSNKILKCNCSSNLF